MRSNTADEFPFDAEELRGIAEGSGQPVNRIWCANLLTELGALISEQEQLAKKKQKHCSDVYAVSRKGFDDGFALGHNDDWDRSVMRFWYIASYQLPDATEPTGFKRCAGLSYPGALVGWAPTWNQHGIYSTQNSMLPKESRSNGLGCAFVQR